MLRLLLLTLLLGFFPKKSLHAQCPPANPVTVINNTNAGNGSLNWAIACINSTPVLTTIEFNLPGATVISPTAAAPLPNITKANALIDGLTQPTGTVIIDGSAAAASANGLTIAAAGGNVTIRGLHIRDFNGTAGGGTGIAINTGNSCDLTDNRLTNNRIGISTATVVNTFTISDNIIGLTAAGGASGHSGQGINIASVPTSGIITDNTIANSSGVGINIAGGTVFISDNSIYCNLGGGITRSGGPAAPVITAANTQRIRGTAAAGRVIEVFSHSTTGCTAAPCQGKTPLGTVTTPANGIWQLNLSTGQITGGTPITATSTQAANNTSVFSTCFSALDCANLNANITINNNVSCFGGMNGSATASATGFSPLVPPTFLWSNMATTTTINNLTAATYTVTVTDAAGCTNSETATISQPTLLSVSVGTTPVSCFGGNNGTATATATGGTTGAAGYTYLWSNSQTSQTAISLIANTYTVIVTDAAGCTATASGTVTQPSAALAGTVGTTPVTCFGGNNGTATANPTGGTTPYNYLWNNGQTAQTAINLTAATYTVTVSDLNGCTIVRTGTVSQPTTLSATVSTTAVTCFGGNNGTATASPTGGTPGGPGYTYLWSNGQTTQTATSLAAATYTVTVSDFVGCTAIASGTVGQPPALSVSVSTTPVECFGESTGSAIATASGGQAGYTYLWNTGSGSPMLVNIPAGVYTVTATDAASCTATATGSVGQPTALSVSVSTTGVSCFGGNNGTATAAPAGGLPGYNYLWSNGQTTPTATNLAAATYTITVTDANGCTVTRSASVSQPTALTLSLSSTDETAANANDGTATATAGGGTPTLLYLWSNGATTPAISGLAPGLYTVTVTDANGCSISDLVSISPFQCAGLNLNVTSTNITCFGLTNGTATATPSGTSGYLFLWNTGATTASIGNLAPGAYTATVTDAAGCTAVDGTNISQPSAISLSVTSSNVTCNGAANGTASASATGGTPSFSYTWSNGASGQNLAGLPPATYTVTATDAAGCTASQTVTIAQPPALTLSVSKTDETAVNANNGTAIATAGGGTPTLNLLWSNGATTASITNLAPGTYTVTLTDANGCTRTASASIAAFGCGGVSVGISKTDATCSGLANGTATANPTGGNTPYNYLWSNGQTGKTATALAAATYTVTVTDATGCTASQTVSIAQPPALTLSVSKTDETAVTANNGTATATTGGGTPTLNLLWSNGATTLTISNLAPGTYTATVTDANGCTRTASASIAAFGCAGVSVGISKTDVACNGLVNGTATANPAGGTTPYNYLWSNGQTGKTATVLAAATYTVIVTDAAGCTASQTVTIAQPPALTLGISKTDETAANKKDGSATATAGGGTPTLNLLWSNGATTASITNLAPGTYTATVTDANGCTRMASATVAAGSGGGGGGCKSLPVYAVLAPSQVCGNQPFVLEADDLFPHPVVRYVWYFPNGDSAISAKTALSITPTSSAFSGEYFVLRDSAGCRSKLVGGAPVTVTSLAPGALSAGNDTLICSTGVVVLRSNTLPSGTAAWVSLGTAKVDNPALTLTSARNLVPGPNRFVWKVDLPGCPNAAADTVTYFLEVAPLARDDRYTLQRASDVAVMEVLLNDNLIGLPDTIVYQLNSPAVGTLEYLAAGRRFRYKVDEGYRGTVTFQYAVCPESASACGFDCDTATVTIEVLNLPKVPEGLILDDPGENGKLTIKGISDLRLEISMFNRWGDLVFSSKDYGKEALWTGDFNGKRLPQGAYYYHLRVYEAGQPLGDVLKGVVHLLERN